MARPEPLEDQALQPRTLCPRGQSGQKAPTAATEEDAVSTTDDSEEASDEDLSSATPSPVAAAAARTSRATRRVHFDEEPHQVYSVVPYREIYGMHPRLFDFAKDYSMVPAKGQPTPAEILARSADLEEDESGSDDEWDDEVEWDEVWTLSTTPLADAHASAKEVGADA